MSRRLLSSVVGAIVVILLVGLQSIEHWTLIEHAIEGLRDSGPVGMFLVGVLTSRILPLVLALLTIVIAIEVRMKQLEKEEVERVPAKIEARIESTGNSSATGGSASIGAIHIHPPMVSPAPMAPPMPVPRQKIVHVDHTELLVKSVYLDDGGTKLYMGDKPDSWLAVILPIFLDAVKSDAGVYMEYVNSTLVFTESNSQKTTRISHGVWIDPTLHYVEMSAGEIQYLVAAVFKGDLSSASAISSNVTDYEFCSNNADPFSFEELSLSNYEVQVVVMWSGTARGKVVFNLNLDFKQLAESV
jgi:hypothetical protein